MLRPVRLVALAVALLAAQPQHALAWNRGNAKTFAVLPQGAANPEGIEVDAAGNVYVTTFNPTATTGSGEIHVFNRNGKFLRTLTVAGSSPALLGLAFHPDTGRLLVIDFGAAKVLDVNPNTGASAPFTSGPPGSGLNDLTFDKAGNVYISDSFGGTILRTPPDGTGGAVAPAWVTDPVLRPNGVPPFGANGLRFNKDETTMFVANTANDTIVKIPVLAGGTSNPQPGVPAVFVNSINGADGLVIDDAGNLWVAANQADEIVVVDSTTGRALAKLGDFDGIQSGIVEGLLFPASLRFSRGEVLVTNLALDTKPLGFVTVDTAWAQQVTRFTVARLPAKIPSIAGLP
jgi:sugar lactone lactonase YvrE